MGNTESLENMFRFFLERENQKEKGKTDFYNSYYIINTTDNQIEAIYEGELYANYMLRNFMEYYPSKNFIIAETANQVCERPTNKQLYRILQIENGCKIPFKGLTKSAASKFLDRHISKTKQFDNEIDLLWKNQM